MLSTRARWQGGYVGCRGRTRDSGHGFLLVPRYPTQPPCPAGTPLVHATHVASTMACDRPITLARALPRLQRAAFIDRGSGPCTKTSDVRPSSSPGRPGAQGEQSRATSSPMGAGRYVRSRATRGPPPRARCAMPGSRSPFADHGAPPARRRMPATRPCMGARSRSEGEGEVEAPARISPDFWRVVVPSASVTASGPGRDGSPFRPHPCSSPSSRSTSSTPSSVSA